jgi:hypothetical protein
LEQLFVLGRRADDYWRSPAKIAERLHASHAIELLAEQFLLRAEAGDLQSNVEELDRIRASVEPYSHSYPSCKFALSAQRTAVLGPNRPELWGGDATYDQAAGGVDSDADQSAGNPLADTQSAG